MSDDRKFPTTDNARCDLQIMAACRILDDARNRAARVALMALDVLRAHPEWTGAQVLEYIETHDPRTRTPL